MEVKKLCVCSLLALTLTGCAQDDTTIVSVSSPTPSATPAVMVKEEYSRDENLPLVADNRKFGYVKVNQIEKVYINDFTTNKSEINHSYSINLTVALKNSPVGDIAGFTCEPTIIDETGKSISSLASVGWTGFNTSAELFNANAKDYFEVGFQPTANVTRGCKLQLTFKDDLGTNYRPIMLNTKALQKVVKGPHLKDAGKRVNIKSANGAVYSIIPKRVNFEDHDSDVNLQSMEQKKYFDIDYTVEARRGPKNNRPVGGIIGKGKSATMVCSSVIGLQTPNNAKIQYLSNPKAGRQRYAEVLQTYPYVTEGGDLKFGYKRTVTTNRAADVTTQSAPHLVRLRVEFPEEMKARTSLKSKLKFSGRFLVYQMRITKRKYEKY